MTSITDSNSGISGSNKSGWRKTIVTVAVVAALTALAWREPQYTGEVVLAFLGVIGIHSQSSS
jgi:hypothetical protein